MDAEDPNHTRERRARTGLYVKGSNGLKLRDQRVRKLVQRMRARDNAVARGFGCAGLTCVCGTRSVGLASVRRASR